MTSSLHLRNDFDSSIAQGLRSHVAGTTHQGFALFSWCRGHIASRVRRPWRALVIIPLAMVAAGLSGADWLMVPLIAACWWWMPREDGLPWMWILGILEAAWGLQWSVFGITLITMFPSHLVTDGLVWAGYAYLVAAIGAFNHLRLRRRYGW